MEPFEMRPVWRTETTRNRPLILSTRSHSNIRKYGIVRLVGARVTARISVHQEAERPSLPPEAGTAHKCCT